MEIRLNKFLSQRGVASRRQADCLIAEGRVSVNGQVVEELGYKIDDQKDLVKVDGKKIKKERKFVYIMLNKPPGYLVTLQDPFRRQTVRSLIPSLKDRVFPVGRLDCESQGLLLLTNDGELAFRLTHPRYEVKKTYLVEVEGEVLASEIAALEKGIFLERKRTSPAHAAILEASPKRSLLKIEIHEGRKREIRKMCETIGHDVLKLERVSFAGLTLIDLPLGKWRFLHKREIAAIKKQAGLEG